MSSFPATNGSTVCAGSHARFQCRIRYNTGCVCSCCSWFQIVDHLGSVLYTINIPLCECWAAPRPTICCPLWQAEVRRGEGDGGTVATLQNIFAGCNIRGLFTKADNFQASGSLSVSSSTDNSALHCTCVQIARPVAARRELTCPAGCLAGQLLGSQPAAGAQSTDAVLDVPHRHGLL